jgi:mRNA interferase HigB
MRVINLEKLSAFQNQYAEARDQSAAWLDFIRKAQWNRPQDVQSDFGDDVVIPKSRAVFNIKGKKYRIVVAINYQMKAVDIRFAGTHREYNKIDALTI